MVDFKEIKKSISNSLLNLSEDVGLFLESQGILLEEIYIQSVLNEYFSKDFKLVFLQDHKIVSLGKNNKGVDVFVFDRQQIVTKWIYNPICLILISKDFCKLSDINRERIRSRIVLSIKWKFHIKDVELISDRLYVQKAIDVDASGYVFKFLSILREKNGKFFLCDDYPLLGKLSLRAAILKFGIKDSNRNEDLE